MKLLYKRLFAPVLIALLALQGCGCEKQPNDDQVGASPEDLTGAGNMQGVEENRPGEPSEVEEKEETGEISTNSGPEEKDNPGILGQVNRSGNNEAMKVQGIQSQAEQDEKDEEKDIQEPTEWDENDEAMDMQELQSDTEIGGNEGDIGTEGNTGEEEDAEEEDTGEEAISEEEDTEPEGTTEAAATEPNYPWELPPVGATVTVFGRTYTYNGNWWDCEDSVHFGGVYGLEPHWEATELTWEIFQACTPPPCSAPSSPLVTIDLKDFQQGPTETAGLSPWGTLNPDHPEDPVFLHVFGEDWVLTS